MQNSTLESTLSVKGKERMIHTGECEVFRKLVSRQQTCISIYAETKEPTVELLQRGNK